MKTREKLSKTLMIVGLFALTSCGPVIISSRPSAPPPPWFYPNRVETVRYVYFPDYIIYYDLYLSNYLYFENGVWVTVKSLPPRFRHLNLRKSRFIRVTNFQGDNIESYHQNNVINRGRSSRDKTVKRRGS